MANRRGVFQRPLSRVGDICLEALLIIERNDQTATRSISRMATSLSSLAEVEEDEEDDDWGESFDDPEDAGNWKMPDIDPRSVIAEIGPAMGLSMADFDRAIASAPESPEGVRGEQWLS